MAEAPIFSTSLASLLDDSKCETSESINTNNKRAAVFRTNATVIFLIRQGGVDACEWAGRVARQHRLRHGEIPLVGAGALDFSAMSG